VLCVSSRWFEGFEIKAYKEEIMTDPSHGEADPHKHGAVLLFARKPRMIRGHPMMKLDISDKNAIRVLFFRF